MRDVAEIVASLESRGVRFFRDKLGVRFDAERATLLPGDPEKLHELVIDRVSEVDRFLRGRGSFGACASVFRSAVYRICNPPEMLPWLRERCPTLYLDLVERLPDRVCTLWREGASVEEFEAAARRLEESHRAARGFYLACREPNPKEEMEE
jgi:hypothetical protein